MTEKEIQIMGLMGTYVQLEGHPEQKIYAAHLRKLGVEVGKRPGTEKKTGVLSSLKMRLAT